jgi:hypothetical protein
LREIIWLVIEVYYWTFFIQEDITSMAPSRVDPNRKQAKSSIDQVEEDPFCIDRMARTVSAPSQATVHLAKMTPRDLY